MVIYNVLPKKDYEIIFMYKSIDSAFARFNTIITSLKALDEGYSSKNYVRKFLRALHPKWRAKVVSIEESKDLTSLSLDELIGNLKVHEMIIKKDSKIVKAKGERKSIALKAKKESKCPKPPKDKNQRAFVGGSWSDSGEEDDENAKDETCLAAQASNEICSNFSYFSDENSSIDDLALDNEYDKLLLNMTFNETPPPSKTSSLVDDDLDEEEAIKVTEKQILENDIEDETLEIDKIVNIKESRNHPLENELVPQPRNMKIIGTKWVFRNKLDENGIVSRNKGRLVAQGYNRQEGIGYDETYASFARLGSIRILLAYACTLDFTLFQMDVKMHSRTILSMKRKSTSGIYTFVGCCLTSWFSKKQTTLAISTTEAKYVKAKKACQQALWMKQTLIDYNVRLDDISIMCNNKGAIELSKNPVQHSRTKRIEIRHRYLHDNIQKGHISIEKVPSVDNIANILTKPLKRESFNYLHLGLGMMEHIP
nr:retrovirus-related Pol polyprotein from transposon TNT 1-94 [Tanacetum cinerariifolium]